MKNTKKFWISYTGVANDPLPLLAFRAYAFSIEWATKNTSPKLVDGSG